MHSKHDTYHNAGMIQPLDVFGFRVYKNYVRHFSEFVILNEIDVVLHQRNNIIKLQSLVYNQLCSPRYKSLFKYSWFKVRVELIFKFMPAFVLFQSEFINFFFQSGYLLERPDSFENPVKFCFYGLEISCSSCQEMRMLTCSWCKTHLCFNHFFTLNHLCYRFNP